MMAELNGGSDVKSLISQMNSVAEASNDLEHDDATRASLLQLSRKITLSLQAPGEVCSMLAFSGVFISSVRIADQLGIFDLLAEKPSWSTEDLASVTGAEQGLVVRLLRILSGLGFAAQLGTDEFGATDVSRQMTKASVKAGVRVFHEETLPSARYAPEFFKQNNYRLPQTQTDGPYNFAENTTDDAFTHMSKKPGVMENFNVFMQGLFQMSQRVVWINWFPLNERVLDGFDASKGEYCIVDVGGGKGHECERILQKHPDVKGRLVTQDLQFVVDDIRELDPRIEKMCHDFRKPQPIHGARAYFLQNILHNWASPVCIEILRNIKSAMIPGYSKIIVANIVLPDMNVPIRQSGLDMAMLLLHSGQQRNGGEFTKLFEEAGLEVTQVYYPPGDGDGIVEAMLPSK